MKNTVSIGLLASVLAVSALAGAGMSLKKPGFYAVSGLGYGATSVPPGYEKSFFKSRDSLVYALSVGYQINKALGVEVGYMKLPSERSVLLNPPDGDYARGYLSAITLLGRYTQPLSSDFDLIVGAGISVISAQDALCDGGYCDQSSRISTDFYQVAPTFSLGANYHLNKKVSLGVEGRMTTHAAVYPETYTGLVNLSYRLGA